MCRWRVKALRHCVLVWFGIVIRATLLFDMTATTDAYLPFHRILPFWMGSGFRHYLRGL